MITRRRFAFWVSFGLFSLAEKLHIGALDELAAATMRGGGDGADRTSPVGSPVHWRTAENGVWRWIERETYIDGQWTLSGITTPVNKSTGASYAGKVGYLDENDVPLDVRFGVEGEDAEKVAAALAEFAEHHASDKRRARHGRPPSKWLRSLHADELRIWLKTIDVPEASVSGMTTWEHLTRDHSFHPEHIEGLTEDEQSKLHAAAHFGY